MPLTTEQVRDTIVAAVARETGVTAQDIMNMRSRGQRTVGARRIAMWVLREVLEQSEVTDETEIHDVFGTTVKIVDRACWHVYETPALRIRAEKLLGENRPATSVGV